MSPTLWELPDRLHEFFWLSFSRILLFSFTFPLSQGNMPISWCPEISFYVARHFVLISFNEFSSAPTHLLNHGFVHSKEDTEGCWCFWLLFMPSVLIFFKFCFLFFFSFFMNIHVFLAVFAGAHLVEWHGSCSQVESDPCWRGYFSGNNGFLSRAAGTLQDGAPLCHHWHHLLPSTSTEQLTLLHLSQEGQAGWGRKVQDSGLPGKLLVLQLCPRKSTGHFKKKHVSNNWKGE